MSRLNKLEPLRLIRRDGTILYQAIAASIRHLIEGALDVGVVLENLDLSYQDLSFINMDESVIRNVSFVGANLMGANLSEATLEGCNFSEANLNSACMAYSKLRFCQFWQSECSALDLSCAELEKVMFSGKGICAINFYACDEIDRCYLYNDARTQRIGIDRQLDMLRYRGQSFLMQERNIYTRGEIYQRDDLSIGPLISEYQRSIEGIL